jgi:hypothetical protein
VTIRASTSIPSGSKPLPAFKPPKPATAISHGIPAKTKLLVGLAATLLFGGVYAFDNAGGPTATSRNTASAIASTSHAITIGAFAPPLTLRLASPVASLGKTVSIGYGHWQDDGAVPVVVGVFSSTPACDCGRLRTALNSLAHRVAAKEYGFTPNIFAVDASQIGQGNRTSIDEQYGFNLGLDVPLGADASNSRPPDDVAMLWADQVVPSAIVIDHDGRVRYIARGKDAGDLPALDRALRASIAHYKREHQATQ